jgi:chromosomal replication initiation ATPase DnaA
MSVHEIIDDLNTRDALELAERIAKTHGVALDDMLGRCRRRPLSRARHELWARLYEEAIPTFAALGRVFERDHTTIRDGVRQHAARQSLGNSVTTPLPDGGSPERTDACAPPR